MVEYSSHFYHCAEATQFGRFGKIILAHFRSHRQHVRKAHDSQGNFESFDFFSLISQFFTQEINELTAPHDDVRDLVFEWIKGCSFLVSHLLPPSLMIQQMSLRRPIIRFLSQLKIANMRWRSPDLWNSPRSFSAPICLLSVVMDRDLEITSNIWELSLSPRHWVSIFPLIPFFWANLSLVFRIKHRYCHWDCSIYPHSSRFATFQQQWSCWYWWLQRPLHNEEDVLCWLNSCRLKSKGL